MNRRAFLLAGLLEQGVWDGTVLSSFEALQPVLKVWQQVRVSDEIVDSGWKGFAIGTAAGAAVLGLAGNSYAAMPGAMLGGIVGYLVDRSTHSGMSVTGKVVSISSDQLVIARPRAFFRSEEWAFTEDVVRSIHIVDSDLNGILLGMAPGMALMFLSCGQSDAGNLCGLVPMMVTGLGMMVVGVAIDFFMTLCMSGGPMGRESRSLHCLGEVRKALWLASVSKTPKATRRGRPGRNMVANAATRGLV